METKRETLRIFLTYGITLMNPLGALILFCSDFFSESQKGVKWSQNKAQHPCLVWSKMYSLVHQTPLFSILRGNVLDLSSV